MATTDLLDEAEAALRAIIADTEARAANWWNGPLPAIGLLDANNRPILLDVYLGLVQIELARAQIKAAT